MEGTHRAVRPRITVAGAGTGGGSAVDRMIAANLRDVRFIAVDTDLQALQRRRAHVKVSVGIGLTHGLGSGGDWTRGRDATAQNRAQLMRLLSGTDLLFVTAGMGGGTGTGASGVLAEVARTEGVLTIGVVTRPFRFEGRVRGKTAEAGIEHLRERVDTLIVVPNDRLSQVDRRTTLEDAFRIADDVLRQGVQAIADLLLRPGLLDIELADVAAIVGGAGEAVLGIGFGSGPHRSEAAAVQAVASPILERSMDGARRILFTIAASSDLALHECRVASIVRRAAAPGAQIVFGVVEEPRMQGEMRVTLVATAFGRRQPPLWPSGVPAWPLPRTDGEGAMRLWPPAG